MQGSDTDVIIVGAGPTGLMLAGELRLAGVGAIVLERLAEPMRQSRALGFSARTMEEFAQRGLLADFGDLGVIETGHFGGMPVDYTIVPGGNFGVRGVPQSRTEAILARWATGLGAEVRRGWELTGLTVTDEGAEAQFATPDGPRRLRAAYVAGCDGARSTVRALTGIEFPGFSATIEMLMADFTGVELPLRPSGQLGADGLVIVLPLGPSARRVVIFERAAGVRARTGAPAFAEVAGALQRVTGEDIRQATPLWTSSFTDASRHAREYRRGRVFLAGDAAHIHMPIGAQGISAGVGDAANLGWKLAATINGYAPADLLDTYHTERHPVGGRIVANTLAQRLLYLSGAEMDPMRELMAELLDYEDVRKLLVGMVSGLDIRYDVGPAGPTPADHPLLGRRLPDVELPGVAGPDGGPATAYQFLHSGRGVLLDLAGDGRLEAAAEPWAGQVEVVTAAPGPARPLADVAAALVRPDGYIAWLSAGQSGADGLPAALSRWFGPPRVNSQVASRPSSRALSGK